MAQTGSAWGPREDFQGGRQGEHISELNFMQVRTVGWAFQGGRIKSGSLLEPEEHGGVGSVMGCLALPGKKVD